MLRHIIYLIFFFNIIIWHLPKHIPKTQSFRLGFDFWAFYFGYNIPVNIYIYIWILDDCIMHQSKVTSASEDATFEREIPMISMGNYPQI